MAEVASYWQREAGWRDRWAGAQLPGRVDVAVIGGGFAGLATALRARELEPSATIAVLEAERIGHGASGRNAGFLSPVAAPVWLLSVDRSAELAWAVAHLEAEVHRLASWIATIAPAAELAPATLGIESTRRITDAGLREFGRALEIAGVAHQLAPGPVDRELVLAMNAYLVHPYRLAVALAEAAAGAGVHIGERARVRAIERTPAGTRLRLDGAADVVAARVAVCTNAYTAALGLGDRLAARAVHSFMLASAPVAALPRRDVDFTVELNLAETYHRLHRDRVLVGGRDTRRALAGGDFAVPPAIRARLSRDLRARFGPSIDVAEVWSGALHDTATGLPVIRRSATNPAVVLDVGYGGTGVALALICAPMVAALVCDREPEPAGARLLAAIADTRVPLGDAARALGRLARRLATPWRT